MTQIVWMGFMEMFSTLKFKALHCFLFFFLSFFIRERSGRSQSKALVLHLKASPCTSLSEGWREKQRRTGRGPLWVVSDQDCS